ncbi:MAG: YncE family protein [Candidatus Bathyarchaeia archaeon]|jgi:YVTN family beta-propeller protein
MKAKVLRLLVFIFLMIFACSIANSVHAIAVTSTITVGGAPWGVAYDSGKSEIFVVNSAAGSVSVLSDSNYAVLAKVTVGTSPYRDLYDSNKGEIFVANYGANSVSVISDKTNKVVATVTVGTSPSSFTYDSAKGEIFVANSGGGTVSVISDSTNKVVATVTVGTGPYDLDYDSAKGEVFVANAYSRSVSVISDGNNQVVATVAVGSGPLGVAYDSAQSEIFVANSVSGTVSVISDTANTVIATPTVGSSPAATVYDSGKGEIFVLNRSSASVSVISDSNNTVIATVAVGTNPYGAAYDSGKSEVFVANEGDGTVSVTSDASSTSSSPSPTSSASSGPTATPTSSPTQTVAPSSTPNIVQQVWVPNPTNTVAAVGVSAVVMGAFSLLFAAISNPLGDVGGTVSVKTKGIIPDNLRQWLEEVVSSRRKLEAIEKSGSLFKPTKTEILAYIVLIIVLAVSFSYVKVITLSQIWVLLPVFFATSFIVGFVQKFFSIVYLRSKGVWSEHMIWPLGLVLFLFTTFAFKIPFSSPTRSVNSKKFTEHLGALVAASEIFISIAFAGFFFLLLRGGYAAIGDAGLSMCVIGSFFGTFPVTPLSGKDIFNHSKRLWAGLFITTLIIFVAWLLLI